MSNVGSVIFLFLFLNIVGISVAGAHTLVVHTIGSSEVVFDTTKQACDPLDIPDTNARAFRDNHNQVHLFASHFIWRASIGPTLNTVTRDCHVVYESAGDANPSQFTDYNWLGSIYTLDGRKIAALTHDEYHGWAHPGMCLKPRKKDVLGHCWWNSIGFAVSNDGGSTFISPNPPGDYVASMPTPYDPETSSGATGYYAPTNILHSGQYFFAMINAWSNAIQKHGACLIRTTNVFDPTLWRGWGGHRFNVSFVDPFSGIIASGTHVCTPVYPGTAQSLVFHQSSSSYLLSELAPDKRYGVPGLYISQSRDLLHWDRPVLVISLAKLEIDGKLPHVKYDYFSLLDPTSSIRNS